MKTRRTYEEESKKLAKAIDIAIDVFAKFNSEKDVIKGYETWKNMALHPEPKFRRLASLNYIVDAVFTYFQEGVGEAVELFWRRIGEEGLDYKRENTLQKIFDQKAIKTRIQYEYVQDIFVVAQQQNMITSEQAIELAQMLDRYENRGQKKI